MSLFNGKRLDNETFKLDVERMRRGWYSDKYFVNIATMLQELSKQNYTYLGKNSRLPQGIPPEGVANGDIEVEMQWFNRRPGKTVVVGVDKALTMLKHATGYFEGEQFINTAEKLKVWAVQDGCTVHTMAILCRSNQSFAFAGDTATLLCSKPRRWASFPAPAVLPPTSTRPKSPLMVNP